MANTQATWPLVTMEHALQMWWLWVQQDTPDSGYLELAKMQNTLITFMVILVRNDGISYFWVKYDIKTTYF